VGEDGIKQENVVVKTDVWFYPQEKPKRGQALKGQLILTDRRLAYIRLTAKTMDYSSRINEGLRNEGSFEAPFDKIIEAKSARQFGYPYFGLRYQAQSGEEKTCSFYFTSTINKTALLGLWWLAFAKSPYDQLVRNIEQLKTCHAQAPPIERRSRYCPHCGHELASEDAFCTNCGAKSARAKHSFISMMRNLGVP